ncbi:GDSL esterase/lipase 7-like [Salvia miltiorrhiza]|uniref:GDSL esterase/lipase 7-like n=1 Tax=Salvia miltiorrhiza TaxID=226208 RepID=UPI0025ABAED8|nr:GDSL esterase/lipase 7-like [Salvia miltiorrhiza]
MPFLLTRKMMKSLLIIFFIIIITSADANPEPLAPALYVMGDSLVDSGNNNFLPTVAKANFPPYGINFDGRRSTGRFTNGRTVADFIAEFVGLPYAPPYLSIRRLVESEQAITGLNFASGSCGILPQTGADLGKCLSFPEQVELFEKTVKEDLPRYYKKSEEISDYLAKSLFVISIGSNDYINNYLNDLHDTSKRYSPQSFATLLITNLSQQLQRLYGLGARKVLAFEIGPIGCIPSITRQIQHNGPCVEDINQLVVLFNNQLAAMLQNLTSTLQHSSFILGHVNGLGYDAAISPSKYGLSDSSNPCCVTWLNGTSGCIPGLGALACKQPDKHYFFDAFHLTESLYKHIATLCFNSSSTCIPQNIKDLLL